eukprot:TRINITY_DN77337_c0_g1_i1.p1 TRINITY_DN77337_c0_g1~~TRINITY_DN77337_c0_g1_i1.p1  ORF type:complete len:220 (-),score=29.19 TRINITY_DN77337_c0_g1_i1:593-1252(-)
MQLRRGGQFSTLSAALLTALSGPTSGVARYPTAFPPAFELAAVPLPCSLLDGARPSVVAVAGVSTQRRGRRLFLPTKGARRLTIQPAAPRGGGQGPLEPHLAASTTDAPTRERAHQLEMLSEASSVAREDAGEDAPAGDGASDVWRLRFCNSRAIGAPSVRVRFSPNNSAILAGPVVENDECITVFDDRHGLSSLRQKGFFLVCTAPEDDSVPLFEGIG